VGAAVSYVKRGHAADRRVRPHRELPDPAVPGCCSVCGLRTDLPNKLHTDRPTPAAEAHQAVERRTLGEHD
jgi:hypothetical protein